MFRKSVLLTALAAAVLILAAACGNPAGESQPKAGGAGDLTGTWSRSYSGRTATLTLASDLTFQTDFLGDSTADVWGTYTNAGGQVAFTDLGGPQAESSTVVGTYGYSLSGKTLALTLVSDGASGRPLVVPGTWTKP